MALPLDSIVELTLVGSYANQRILNIRHYRVSQTATPGTTVFQEMTGFAGFFTEVAINSFRDLWLGVQSEDYNWVEARAQPVYPTRLPPVSSPVGADGTIGTGAPSGNLASVITFGTAKTGRDQIGSIHIGPVPAGQMFDGVITPAYKALLDTLKDRFAGGVIIAGTGGGYLPCLWHRGDVTPPVYDDIISSKTQTTVRTMRRRTVGVGI